MENRMTNPTLSVPGVLEGLQTLAKAANEASSRAGLPESTVNLVDLRASQINGCAVCLDMHSRGAKKAGETDERLSTLAAWREAPYFTEAERAALALAEAGTRIADKADPVPDEVLEAAGQALRRASPRRPRRPHRHDQHLEPLECHDPPGSG